VQVEERITAAYCARRERGTSADRHHFIGAHIDTAQGVREVSACGGTSSSIRGASVRHDSISRNEFLDSGVLSGLGRGLGSGVVVVHVRDGRCLSGLAKGGIAGGLAGGLRSGVVVVHVRIGRCLSGLAKGGRAGGLVGGLRSGVVVVHVRIGRRRCGWFGGGNVLSWSECWIGGWHLGRHWRRRISTDTVHAVILVQLCVCDFNSTVIVRVFVEFQTWSHKPGL